MGCNIPENLAVTSSFLYPPGATIFQPNTNCDTIINTSLLATLDPGLGKRIPVKGMINDLPGSALPCLHLVGGEGAGGNNFVGLTEEGVGCKLERHGYCFLFFIE
mmetsp:Transcript_40625/g.69314  ORF Transcript_40625/g.69314 Transcript_40625/m.69314 type:complete len:105 (-) Transcript_40625:281-595(-)